MKREIKFKRIQCLDRSLDIIILVSETHGLTMNEIARKMNMKVSTVYNIVNTLASRGFLSNNNGKFEIGPALGLAASRWDVERSLPHLVEPILEEVKERTGDPVCVTILVNDRQVEIITLQENSHEVSARFIHTTWDYPLYIATGRVLIAFGPNKLWNDIINAQLKNGPVTDAEKEWDYTRWYEHLSSIREDGYVIIPARREQEGGVSAVGVPLFNPAGNLLAAIGASSRVERAIPEHLEEIRDAICDAINNNPLWGIRGTVNV